MSDEYNGSMLSAGFERDLDLSSGSMDRLLLHRLASHYAPLEKFPKHKKFSHSKIFCPAQVKAHTRNSGEIKRSQHLHRCALYVGLVLCASP